MLIVDRQGELELPLTKKKKRKKPLNVALYCASLAKKTFEIPFAK